ncbi:MAG: hypothetical protein AB7F86_02790 [Bdellovibrionales bacterium]
MEKQVQTFAKNDQQSPYFRFQVYQGEKDISGQVKRTKSVGMAYLKEGQNIFTLRLWTFSLDRFYVLPNKKDPTKYLVMTREPNKNVNAKNKYYWNIVGNGSVDSVRGYIELEFDLLSKPIYLNIHPESSPHSVSLPEPEAFADAA